MSRSSSEDSRQHSSKPKSEGIEIRGSDLLGGGWGKPMILNLEDFEESSTEVLEMELERIEEQPFDDDSSPTSNDR